jgi:hypothetical protein
MIANALVDPYFVSLIAASLYNVGDNATARNYADVVAGL